MGHSLFYGVAKAKKEDPMVLALIYHLGELRHRALLHWGLVYREPNAAL